MAPLGNYRGHGMNGGNTNVSLIGGSNLNIYHNVVLSTKNPDPRTKM